MATKTKAAATWESNDSAHMATLRKASEFGSDSFRTKKHDTKGVTLVLGKHESSDSVLKVQSVAFDKEEFDTQADAKRWLQDNMSAVDKTYDSRSGTKLDGKSIRAMGGINKRVVAVHAAADESGASEGIATATPDQLDLINQFTRSPKTADEVAVMPVLACNDVIDRDVDQFTTDTVKGFMALQGPLSPIGKSFMVGHNYNSLPVGRIFDGSVETKGSITWLKLWTYIPNTEQYKSYIENVDFGIYWAVSVGVMLSGATCSVGGNDHEWGWHPYVCPEGHIKGERYSDKSKTDDYGMPEPDPKGELCWRKLVDPTDFYELSQVYLGAQYMAEFDKGIGKAASAGHDSLKVKGQPSLDTMYKTARLLSIRSEEAASLPTPKYPVGTHAAEAHMKGLTMAEQDDGTVRWTSEEGLVYTFDPATDEELCLGRTNEDEETAEEDESSEKEPDTATKNKFLRRLMRPQKVLEAARAKATATDDETPEELVASLDALLDSIIDELDSGDANTADALLTAADLVCDELMEAMGIADPDEGVEDDGEEPTLDNTKSTKDADSDEEEDDEEDEDEDETNEEDEVDKTAVVKSARSAGLPSSLLEKVLEVDKGNGLDVLLRAAGERISQQEKTIGELTGKAALGDSYIKELRADAIHWYTLSQRSADAPTAGVNTDKIERLLTMCGDNADLIKEQREMYRDLARAKFPEAVRRSSFPVDVNERNEVGGDQPPGASSVDARSVKHIHG